MKPFLCYNLSENKYNEDEQNGNEFIVAQTPEYLLESYSNQLEEHSHVIKLKITKVINGFMMFFVIVALITLRGILGATDETPLKEGYANAPWFFWVCGLSAVMAIALFIFGRIRGKKIDESDETKISETRIESVEENIYRNLGVPYEAPYIDVLCFQYKLKDGEIKPKDKILKTTPFINSSLRIFKDNQNLYLAALETKFAFPLSAVKGIKIVKETGTIPIWSKDEPHNKGFYKQFKITYNDGNYSFKTYYILTFEINGEETGIYIPSYDIQIIENLLNITAEK